MARRNGDALVAGCTVAAYHRQVEQPGGRRRCRTGGYQCARTRAGGRQACGTAPRLDAPQRVASKGAYC